MKPGRALLFVGFAIVAAGGYFAYRGLTFEQPPGFSELPASWFVRPATADPADWRMAGATEVKVETPSGANLQVIPEDRTDIQASLSGPQGLTPYPLANGAVAVSSNVKLPCPARPAAGAPTLVLRTPRSVIVRAKGRFVADVGPARNLMIDADGCSTWKIASAQTLWAAERRGAQIESGPVLDLRLARWGKGHDRIAATARSADIIIHGPGGVTVVKPNGVLDASVWGSGRIELGEGFVGRERIWVKGAGRVLHRGEAGEVTGEARLGGRVRVRQARGVITGQGDVEVGRPNAPVLNF